MSDIDWTVIRDKWRRWHPVDPIQMKRHAMIRSLRLGDPTAKLGQPIMENVNGRFGAPAASSPFFQQTVASINRHAREIPGLGRP
jgi:hypothetical protein